MDSDKRPEDPLQRTLTTDGGATWSLRTSGTINTLKAISFGVPNTGFAVGAGGTILRTEDGGDSWMAQSVATKFSLRDGFFVDPNTGTAVGTGGTIVRTTDGGNTWRPQNSRTDN
jgi:photosystem II stability/assembly factor-like uncharacterized protein